MGHGVRSEEPGKEEDLRGMAVDPMGGRLLVASGRNHPGPQQATQAPCMALLLRSVGYSSRQASPGVPLDFVSTTHNTIAIYSIL